MLVVLSQDLSFFENTVYHDLMKPSDQDTMKMLDYNWNAAGYQD